MVSAAPRKLESIFEEVLCPLCGNPETKTIYEASYPANLSPSDFLELYSSSSDHQLMDRLAECSQCHLTYLNPRPTKEIVLRSYSEAVDPVFVEQNEARIATFKRALKRIVGVANLRMSPSTRVLDVGCAGGAFPKAVADFGMSVTGIEPSRWLCEYGKRTYGLEILPGTLEDHTLPKKSFDLITLWDVIEHTHDPVTVLRQCRGLLKDGGTLLVNYPDYSSFVAKAMGKKWPFLLSVHLHYFTPTTIKLALEKAGLKSFRLKPHWQSLPANYLIQRAANYLPLLKWPSQRLKEVGIGRFPMTYYMGQTTVYCRADE